MKKILFICHGNICRSPMAEFVMKDLVKKAKREKEFVIESAATSCDELGNPVYAPARKKLMENGINPSGKVARRLEPSDYDRFDLLVVMDKANFRNTIARCGGDPEGKVHMLLEYAGMPGEEVADPWYTRDFDATWEDVCAGCKGLLNAL